MGRGSKLESYSGRHLVPYHNLTTRLQIEVWMVAFPYSGAISGDPRVHHNGLLPVLNNPRNSRGCQGRFRSAKTEGPPSNKPDGPANTALFQDDTLSNKLSVLFNDLMRGPMSEGGREDPFLAHSDIMTLKTLLRSTYSHISL